jgi:hypothetical protein
MKDFKGYLVDRAGAYLEEQAGSSKKVVLTVNAKAVKDLADNLLDRWGFRDADVDVQLNETVVALFKAAGYTGDIGDAVSDFGAQLHEAAAKAAAASFKKLIGKKISVSV